MTETEIQEFLAATPWAIPVIAVLALWSLAWSIVGLWTAARNGHKLWFGLFIFVHTLGVLEMIYLVTHRARSRN